MIKLSSHTVPTPALSDNSAFSFWGATPFDDPELTLLPDLSFSHAEISSGHISRSQPSDTDPEGLPHVKLGRTTSSILTPLTKMSKDNKMKPPRPSLTQHDSHTSGELSLNTQRTVQKRKRSEVDLDAEDITRSKTQRSCRQDWLTLLQTIPSGQPRRKASSANTFTYQSLRCS